MSRHVRTHLSKRQSHMIHAHKIQETDMDNSEEQVRLSDVCRSCMLKTENMTAFYPKTDATSDLIKMLSAVGNIEIEMGELLPSCLCVDCEEKLRLSYDFQLLIQRSNRIIRECLLNGVSGVADDTEDDNTEYKCAENDQDAATMKLPRKLTEFSARDVEEAIQECKDKFYMNSKCIKCGFISRNARALTMHMTHVHKELKERWCSICNKEVDPLSEHLFAHARDEFKCKFCGKHFTTRSHFTEHLRSHSDEKPYKCHVCDKCFHAQRHLDRHLRIHTDDRRFKCTFCSRNFSERRAYQKHVESHVEEAAGTDTKTLNLSENFCKTCKKCVRSLTDHYKKHHVASNPIPKEKDGYLCMFCGKKANSSTRFEQHMRTHTGEAPYKCSFCDRRTKTRNQMIVHERTHTGEKPHACTICGKSFAQGSVLKTHMKIHTGRPEVCEICSQRFCRPTQLRMHMRQHTGEKPYQCAECGNAFRQRSHLKTHSDERPYKCEHCDKGFKQSSSLKSHVQIHFGEKPFKCSQCSYACRQSYSLTQHMRQHSADAPRPEKPYVCVVCQKGFSTVAMLTSHTDVAHAFVKVVEITELT